MKNFQQKKAEATRPTKRSLGEYDIGKGMGIRQNRGRGGRMRPAFKGAQIDHWEDIELGISAGPG